MLYNTEKEQLELISTARQLLNAEYVKKCTEEYRTWSTVNQHIINRTGEVLLRYPPFSGALSPVSFRSTVAKPTETDVVNKALEIYNREKPIPAQTSELAVVDPITETADEPFAALISTPVEEPVAEEPKAITSEAPTPIAAPAPAAIESKKELGFADRIFDIFKKPAEVPLPEVKKEEPDPLKEPVVVTKVEDTRTDFTVEVPAVVVPEPAPAPAPPPQLTSSYENNVQNIFNDVPKDKSTLGITGMLKRAFSGKKETAKGDTA